MTDTFVSHLECSISGQRYEAGKVHGLSEAGRPLLVRYDLERLAASVSKADIAASDAPGFWRYAPFLPRGGSVEPDFAGGSCDTVDPA